MPAVHEAPFPTVCMLNGHCFGAGFELTMACDMRTASTEARMGLPEIHVGIPSPGRSTGASSTAWRRLTGGASRPAPR